MFLSYLGIALKPRVYQPYKPKQLSMEMSGFKSSSAQSWKCSDNYMGNKNKNPELILQKPIYTLQLHGLLPVLLYS